MPSPPRIFVSIAAYRDAECPWTLKDLFEKAARPERVVVGLCWQGLPGVDPEPDDAMLIRPGQCRVIRVDARDSQGVCWARARIQKLLEDEAYYFQIDSHCRFVRDWDQLLIDLLAACPSTKPVISTYPPPYTPPDQRDDRHFTVMMAKHFGADGLITNGSCLCPLDSAPAAPIPNPFCAAGLLAAPAAFVAELPYDPHLYFQGEETTLAVRAWTHGWDVFTPHRTLIYHQYDRTEPRHWDDHPTWYAANQRSIQRVHHLLGTATSTDPEVLRDIERYSLGTQRTLAAFQAFAGVDFQTRTIVPRRIGAPWPEHAGQPFPAQTPAPTTASPASTAPPANPANPATRMAITMTPATTANPTTTPVAPPAGTVAPPGRKHSLTLTMIVKNEEEPLKTSLANARLFADRILIVDTGSTDRTREVARQFGAEVVEFPWCDDFAKARNHGIERCTTDFIMWLDADDMISAADAAKIDQLMDRDIDWDILYVPYVLSRDNLGRPSRVLNRERIFRNHKGLLFRYPIHEALAYTHGTRVENTKEFEIVHNKQPGATPSNARNLRILQKAIESDEYRKHPRIWWLLATESEPEKAILYYQKLIRDLAGDVPKSRLSVYHYQLAKKLNILNRHDQALESLGQAIMAYPLWREPFFVAGQIYFKQTRFAEALKMFTIAETIPAPAAWSDENDPLVYGGDLFYEWLFCTYHRLDQREAMARTIRQALAQNPTNPNFIKWNQAYNPEAQADKAG